MQIYFISTNDSSRSKMAEGFAKVILPTSWIIKSAGVSADKISPYAIQVMSEVGIDIAEEPSQSIDDTTLTNSDVVVSLSRDAKSKTLALPTSVQAVHWPLNDPTMATGSEKQKVAAFREIRDEIKQYVTNIRDEYRQ